jgi:succinate dehydrogenase/fumarate reductase flavoprotein subunit
MNREELLSRIEERTEPWDLLVIGGGATGAGIAVDAASRGYDLLLLEQSDFGKGTYNMLLRDIQILRKEIRPWPNTWAL